jgi:carbonic anhydrase
VFYSPKTILNKVENNGHSIQFAFYPGDSIIYQHKSYYLKQIHFHEPAEHLLNGVKYPIEIHLVHISKDNNITVLGILGMEGEDSQLFEFLEGFLPLENGEEKVINQRLDLTDLFPDVTDFYSYEGSLTTPPCTENVNWVIFKNPIIISLEEVLKLKNNMPLNNYRNEQPVNDRIIYHNLELQ